MRRRIGAVPTLAGTLGLELLSAVRMARRVDALWENQGERRWVQPG